MILSKSILLSLINKSLDRKLIFILFLFFSSSLLAQFSSTPGIPFIKNFTEEETKSSLTVYDISQGINGEMYFSTPGGLLEYDGARVGKITHMD